MNSADPHLPRLGLVRERAEEARHLVEALAELGVTPVLELSGADLASKTIADAEVEVLVVGLGGEIDPGVFASLDRIRVVFDDLEASATLSGWDRSRWLRHLRAKLLGIPEQGPPRPAGAEPIPARVGTGPQEAGIPATTVEGPSSGRHGGAASSASQPLPAAGRIADLPTTESTPDRLRESASDRAVVASEFDGPEWIDQSAAGHEAPPREQAAPASARDWSLETVESIAGAAMSLPAEPDSPAMWDPSGSVEPRPTEESVEGLDELLDALRRDQHQGDDSIEAAADVIPTAAAEQTTEARALERFNLSGLSLEPLDHERPVTGRARFVVDDTPRDPAPQPPTPPAAAVSTGRSSAATSAWLLAAGEAEHARVTEFLEALPADLEAMILLVRPASAPWLGATLAIEGGRGLPMVLGDEVMEATGGRVVVLSPGERAGFNRTGQLTVQPGDHAMPEALGDWMTMRALAGRYGRDAGVIVFGRLRDEVLEGAIELARAGGQVWFEASVLDGPNPVVDAAQAAGIAMRTGTAPELAAALIARFNP